MLIDADIISLPWYFDVGSLEGDNRIAPGLYGEQSSLSNGNHLCEAIG